MAQYLQTMQDQLLARGLMRTDAGQDIASPTPSALADEFVQIALRDEYSRRGTQLVPGAHPAPLRRWQDPVRMQIAWGDTVPRPLRAKAADEIAGFAARLGRVSRHPVSMTSSGGNFVVLVVNEEDRRSIAARLNALVPGIPADDAAAIEQLAPQNYCTVFAYSSGGASAYSNAVAVIRAELPDRMRLSCIHEELAQGMGLANDSPDARPSIFNDDEEFALLTGRDELLLRMLYDPRLAPGMTEAEARPIAESIAAELLARPPS